MSYADTVFKETCIDILYNGTNTRNQKVRPVWEDGTPAYTIKQFGVVNTYNLRNEFPILTIRPVPIKLCVDEILWIYQKKSNNVKDLDSHIWDQWADDSGSIGTCYGYTAGQQFVYENRLVDQTDYVLKQLKETPFSRRIMTNLYQYKNLATGALDPCAYSLTLNVTEENGIMILNGILNQRSQDMVVANGWNVVQYAILLMMFAQVSNMIPGKLIHVIADAHIYDRHIDIIEELLSRKAYKAPKVRLNPEIKNFYDFTPDDVMVEDYKHHKQIKNIPVAK